MFVHFTAALLILGSLTQIAAANCQDTSVGFIPLTDLGSGTYKGFEGGLYPGGVNVPPLYHLAEGLAASSSIKPLNLAGAPASSGKIVLISMGMSNTTQEFSNFVTRIGNNKNPNLEIVDCAQGGRDVTPWSNPTDTVWAISKARLAARGVTASQVQVVWAKHAKIQPTDTFPTDARNLQGYYEKIAENIRVHFPKVQLVFWSSRIYAGYASSTLNPEPFAHQSGFAVKWMIEKQISGDTTLNVPWMGWGPYLWADGLTLRSDGLIWECSDFNSDGTHPSDPSGRQKVAALLEDFFRSNALTMDWFNAGGAGLSQIHKRSAVKVSIFPNPFLSRFSIHPPIPESRIILFTLQGQRVWESGKGGEEKVRKLPAGIYTAVVEDRQGRIVTRSSIVKF